MAYEDTDKQFKESANNSITLSVQKQSSQIFFSVVKKPSTISAQIPFHIQEEIMRRLPVKSLVQFRSVSKRWKSLIDSSEFIAAHSLYSHTQHQHLLVSHLDVSQEEDHVLFCQSYTDDDTFPKHRSDLTLPPLFAQRNFHPRVIGSSHGLLFLYNPAHECTRGMVVIWNPSIRKSIVVDVPANLDGVGVGQSLVYPFLTPALPQHHHRPIRRHYPPPPPWSAFSVNDLFRWKHEPFTIATTQSFQSNQMMFNQF
ncbi:F-box protein At2g21930 [Lactuca sativa]|uniref:F-box protein At2g21930 n=1 Tax=Lactuca sativa TaxID=4236 RepID=UPI000CD8D9F3|nr:F-box protein At2g21930 [Lactuca sativa]